MPEQEALTPARTANECCEGQGCDFTVDGRSMSKPPETGPELSTEGLQIPTPPVHLDDEKPNGADKGVAGPNLSLLAANRCESEGECWSF